MELVAKVLLPVLVVFMMTIVGTELTVADFKRALRHPLLVPVAVAGQILLLPVIAGMLVWLLSADTALAAGLILVSACPIAAIFNYYTMLARGNVALAVTLTAVSSAAALVTTPLVASAGFALLLHEGVEITLPILPTVKQMAVGLVLPILAGMALRHWAPAWTGKHRVLMQRLSIVALVVLILVVLVDQAASIRTGLASLVLAALLFTVAALGVGYLLATLVRDPSTDRFCIALGASARNLSIAILIAANVLGSLEYVAFAAVFFLAQLAVLLPLIYRLRVHRAGAQASLYGAGL